MARIVRPQGRRGEVLAEIATDFPERFSGLREAFLQRRPNAAPERVRLEGSWLHKGHIVLKFVGVDSISAAELLRGTQVVIPAEARVALATDEVYVSDLIGCRLLDRTGGELVLIGSIRDVIQQNGTADLLVVVSDNGSEHWIPFARAYAPEVDLADRCVKMDLPSGILAMNAPLSEEERHACQTANETPNSSTEEA